jgi:branched-chain amino acid transport system ATP-binding protein
LGSRHGAGSVRAFESDGEQQMLAVGRALRQLNTMKNITILVVEQNAKVVLEFAGRGYVLKTGEIIVEGASAELVANPDVKKAYLGG